jgi:hypothetical protein
LRDFFGKKFNPAHYAHLLPKDVSLFFFPTFLRSNPASEKENVSADVISANSRNTGLRRSQL